MLWGHCLNFSREPGDACAEITRLDGDYTQHTGQGKFKPYSCQENCENPAFRMYVHYYKCICQLYIWTTFTIFPCSIVYSERPFKLSLLQNTFLETRK